MIPIILSILLPALALAGVRWLDERTNGAYNDAWKDRHYTAMRLRKALEIIEQARVDKGQEPVLD